MSNVNRMYVDEREVMELIESSLAPIKAELKNNVKAIEANTLAIEANTAAIQKNAADVKPWGEAYQTANNIQKFSLWVSKFSIPFAIVGLIADRIVG